MTLENRKLGYNVIHLIYSLRQKNGNKNIQLGDEWKNILNGRNIERDLSYYYPSSYSKEYKVLKEELVVKYFHPNVHHVLFAGLNYRDSVGMKVYQYQGKKHSRIFQAYESQKGCSYPTYKFEWIATELYQLQNSHFLVVRLSLCENQQFDSQSGSFKNGQLTVRDWTKFVNRIRINHLKYDEQSHLLVCTEHGQQRLFFDYVQDFLDTDPYLKNHFIIANRCLSDEIDHLEENGGDSHLLREPMAFVQGMVTKVDPAKEQWDDKELYTLLSVDDYVGESGGTDSFIKEFVRTHTYQRWANEQTFYTAIDYAAITIASTQNPPCYIGDEKKWDFVGDILYQHHCNHYLILVLLQLYYREELQEILGAFSRLRAFDQNEEEIKKARAVIDQYYNLNQYFIFDRLTNEIQGIELWKFYQHTFATTELYRSVQQDMQELNQRLIEYENKNQSAELKLLTVLAGLTGLFGMNRVIASDSESSLSWVAEITSSSGFGKMLDAVAFVLMLVIIIYALIFVLRPQHIRKMSKKSSLLGKVIVLLFIILTVLQFVF
ncbi:hypothetical protein LH47_01391 [Anoxybacillus thermarum]|uniref:Uncharacterized protein n=1 Tax=Anoxybacillus thermarum TaxID=404937 RepID=A0A0D0Q974_9BACL|nr:hypothetical protein [Anoxybacillus thermarum]KIQ94513.1 hypothetical protein LH47_01391 [Anoxybacillus thermarum]